MFLSTLVILISAISNKTYCIWFYMDMLCLADFNYDETLDVNFKLVNILSDGCYT